MNMKNLNKLYDRLSARERLTLLISASLRGDRVERQRLLDSAPSNHYAIPHHHGLAQALAEAATMHVLTLLDIAASYWQWWGLWGWSELRNQSEAAADPAAADRAHGADDEEGEVLRLMCMSRYQAFLFVTHRDGWRQFCKEWPIEPEALLQSKPGWDMILRTEAEARQHAYSPQEAALFLFSETPLPEEAEVEEEEAEVEEEEAEAEEEGEVEEFELPEVPTAAALARDWHTVIALYLERRGGNADADQ